MTTNDNSNRSWQDGYGPIRHNMETIARVETLLARRGSLPGVQKSGSPGNLPDRQLVTVMPPTDNAQ